MSRPRSKKINYAEQNVVELNPKQNRQRFKHVVLRPRGENQERYVAALENEQHDIVFAVGPAGTGKTKSAVEFAIKQLQDGKIQKIVITRPAVSVDEDHGFLPGTLEEKMAPWILPIIDYFEEYYHPKDVERMIEEKIIEIAPLAYMRGRTFKDAIVLLDEGQLATVSQTKMALTRLGQGSRMIVTGDLNQADRGADNGLNDFITRLEQVSSPYIACIRFTNKDIKRHRVVQDVLKIYGDEE